MDPNGQVDVVTSNLFNQNRLCYLTTYSPRLLLAFLLESDLYSPYASAEQVPQDEGYAFYEDEVWQKLHCVVQVAGQQPIDICIHGCALPQDALYLTVNCEVPLTRANFMKNHAKCNELPCLNRQDKRPIFNF